jgi:hypothetical protein
VKATYKNVSYNITSNDTQANVTEEEAKHPQIDTAEMKNVNTKCKTNKNTQSSGVMASMLFLSVVDRGFKIWSYISMR